ERGGELVEHCLVLAAPVVEVHGAAGLPARLGSRVGLVGSPASGAAAGGEGGAGSAHTEGGQQAAAVDAGPADRGTAGGGAVGTVGVHGGLRTVRRGGIRRR